MILKNFYKVLQNIVLLLEYRYNTWNAVYHLSEHSDYHSLISDLSRSKLPKEINELD